MESARQEEGNRRDSEKAKETIVLRGATVPVASQRAGKRRHGGGCLSVPAVQKRSRPAHACPPASLKGCQKVRGRDTEREGEREREGGIKKERMK